MADAAWYDRELRDQSFKDWADAYKFYVSQRKKHGEDIMSPDTFKTWVSKAGPGWKGTEGVTYDHGGSFNFDAGSFAPPPAPNPMSFEEFQQDSQIAQEYGKVYDAAMAQLQFEVGERKKELRQIANTAKAQVQDIYSKWAPELQAYAKKLGRGGGMTDDQMQALMNEANATLSQNVKSTKREINLTGKAELSQLQQEKELQNLGLYEKYLGDVESDMPDPDQYELKGFISKLENETKLSADEIRRNAISFAMSRYGVSQEEAIGRVDAALGGGSSAQGTPSKADAAVRLVLGRQVENRLNQPGGFKMSERWFIGQVNQYFKDHNLGSPSFYGFTDDVLHDMFANAYSNAKTAYAQRWSTPAPEPKDDRNVLEKVGSWLNPFG